MQHLKPNLLIIKSNLKCIVKLKICSQQLLVEITIYSQGLSQYMTRSLLL